MTGTHVYVIGGYDDKTNQRYKNIWHSTWQDQQLLPWVKIKDYPDPIIHHGAIIVNNHLYVLGGRKVNNGVDTVLDEVKFANSMVPAIYPMSSKLPLLCPSH